MTVADNFSKMAKESKVKAFHFFRHDGMAIFTTRVGFSCQYNFSRDDNTMVDVYCVRLVYEALGKAISWSCGGDLIKDRIEMGDERIWKIGHQKMLTCVMVDGSSMVTV